MAKKFNENAERQGKLVIEFKRKILKKFESNEIINKLVDDQGHNFLEELIELVPEKKQIIKDYMSKNEVYKQKGIEELFDKFYP